jgi:hypothetical protein
MILLILFFNSLRGMHLQSTFCSIGLFRKNEYADSYMNEVMPYLPGTAFFAL